MSGSWQQDCEKESGLIRGWASAREGPWSSGPYFFPTSWSLASGTSLHQDHGVCRASCGAKWQR